MAAITTSFYKLRFIPTGKFYKPATGYSWQKNNLSPTGKTYNKKAIGFSAVSRIYVPSDVLPERDHVGYRRLTNEKVKVIETLPEDWEWVEYEVVERNTSKLNDGSKGNS